MIEVKLLHRLETCIVNAKTELAKRRLFNYTINLIMSEDTKQQIREEFVKIL